ncbi:MAG: phosphoribosyltransferase family protein [Sulfurospirillaceae bacterium]|nr:phosphoribosyltransferase family protein [Sulfurospirillaceae bacterium]MDD2825609.1 phosphoribosyltransferase family protein [Sulfurospirillaceae bacterium]
MRCHLCLQWSWQPLCKTCLRTILEPTPAKRVLHSGLKVYSFYQYTEIANFLHTKHTYLGAKIFAQLAKNSMLPFLQQVNFPKGAYGIPIDDHVRHGYAHSAVLAHALRSIIKPLYKSLRAQNDQTYSGQKLAFRQSHKRNFISTCQTGMNVVLIDDIVTTGTTLEEAQKVLEKNNVHVLFALVLADAKEN